MKINLLYLCKYKSKQIVNLPSRLIAGTEENLDMAPKDPQSSEENTYDQIRVLKNRKTYLSRMLKAIEDKHTAAKGWIENWQKKGWRKADKKPVENKELWEEMLAAMKPHKVSWVKVKGHSGLELNERVDQLAVAESLKLKMKN